jgi:hypothetical protein
VIANNECRPINHDLSISLTVWHIVYLIRSESGYFPLRATKPDSIDYVLNDSPLCFGLFLYTLFSRIVFSIFVAGYIMEQWSRWSKSQTDVDRSTNSGLDRFTLDQLFSNIMLDRTIGTITFSMRIYFEHVFSFLWLRA